MSRSMDQLDNRRMSLRRGSESRERRRDFVYLEELFATVGATKHGYGALNMYLGKFLEGRGNVAKEGQWRKL